MLKPQVCLTSTPSLDLFTFQKIKLLAFSTDIKGSYCLVSVKAVTTDAGLTMILKKKTDTQPRFLAPEANIVVTPYIVT